MSRPRLLDLFCGAGGAAMGYHRAGFDVVGVDIKPQPHFPFDFIQADALTFPLDGFDVIHASPPCQAYTDLRARWPDRDYPELIEPIRTRFAAWGCIYIIENVEEAPLIDPIRICGSAFPPRAIRRHRGFESNFSLVGTNCFHHLQTPRFPPNRSGRTNLARVVSIVGNGAGKSGGFSAPLGRWAMGIDWMSKNELREAVPPDYTEWIGRQLR